MLNNDILADRQPGGQYSIHRWSDGRLVAIVGHEGLFEESEMLRRLALLRPSGDTYVRQGIDFRIIQKSSPNGRIVVNQRKNPVTMSSSILGQANKVVVAFLDGHRLKGYVYNFSTARDFFDLFPKEQPLQGSGTRIELRELKAVFFAKDFEGNAEYCESQRIDASRHGRPIDVRLSDGEQIVGTTVGYNPASVGFFMVPADPQSNNARIFVVNNNVQKIKFV
jgi:hypothetical protein